MVQHRKEPLVNNHYYHIYTRSIAKFVIFNNQEEYQRMYQLICSYRHTSFTFRYSDFIRFNLNIQQEVIQSITQENNHLVEIVAFCIMPTHIHLILKQKTDKGIAKYMSRVLNSYSRYFNAKHDRIGPLWSGRFKSVLVSHDEQLIHLTRYLHLNPTSAGLVANPEDWPNSSYVEYIDDDFASPICQFENIIDINKKDYKKFTENQKDYQRNLSLVKYLTIENYSG